MPLVNHKDKNIKYLIVFSSLINLSSLLLGGVILTYVIDLSNDANTIKHDIVNITDMSLFNNKTELSHYLSEIGLLINKVCDIVKC